MKKIAEIEYREYWVIRVIRDVMGRKEVVCDIDFEKEPTEEEIVKVLLTCKPNEFLSIAHNYGRV